MSVGIERMVNEGYTPSDREEELLDILTDGRETGDPWGYTTPSVAAGILDSRREYMSRGLQNLVRAGWVEQIGRGVYRFVDDPRE